MNGRVDIGRAGLKAGAPCTVMLTKADPDIDDDFSALVLRMISATAAASIASSALSSWPSRTPGCLHGALFTDGLKDRLRIWNRVRAGNVNIAKHIVVLRAFVRHDLSNAAGADDENVLFQLE